MNFLFNCVFSLLTRGTVLYSFLVIFNNTNCLVQSSLYYMPARHPLENRFSLSGLNRDGISNGAFIKLLHKNEKHLFGLLNQWEKEKREKIQKEREEAIYRQYLANRIKGSMARDFLTLRY
jgi:hypothetical protein